MGWVYEHRDENCGWPPKHRWSEPQAGFVERAGMTEGKCPRGFAKATAESLLNSGIHESPPDWDKPFPKAIFNFHDGVVYKALPTNPGLSYHGFPCKGPALGSSKGDMTVRTQRRILAEAQRKGCLQEIEEWFRRHP